MPEDKWLWNEPKTWHDIDRALQEISVLLDYLGTRPDGRLLAYFQDTQTRVADGAAKRTVPPCGNYTEFLNLNLQIRSAFQTGRPDLLPQMPAAAVGQPQLSAEGFVYWSRDFLAAVAAPSTANSIRLTQDYIVRRSRHGSWFRWRRGARTGAGTTMPPVLPDADEPVRKVLARRLAHWVRTAEAITIGVVILTVAVSIYALSGRLILNNAEGMEEAWSKLDAQLEAQEDRLLSSPALPVDSRDRLVAMGLCDSAKPTQTQTETAGAETKPAEKRVSLALTSAAGVRNDAPDNLIPAKEIRASFTSARQMHLCAESAKALVNLFTVTMHLQTWSSVVTERIGEGWMIEIAGHKLTLALPLAPLLGVSYTSIAEYAEDRDGDLCKRVARDVYDERSKAPGCQKLLLTMINRTHRVAQSILGSITLYILPVCYGFLGSMAATLRMLRRKVDASLLSYTDRARLQQGAILGILCGGVIGLFASYIGKADAASGLGLSAVALLAGYNVDGVFRFLDELSDRIFRPSAAPKS